MTPAPGPAIELRGLRPRAHPHPPAPLLALQRACGNRAVTRLLRAQADGAGLVGAPTSPRRGERVLQRMTLEDAKSFAADEEEADYAEVYGRWSTAKGGGLADALRPLDRDDLRAELRRFRAEEATAFVEEKGGQLPQIYLRWRTKQGSTVDETLLGLDDDWLERKLISLRQEEVKTLMGSLKEDKEKAVMLPWYALHERDFAETILTRDDDAIRQEIARLAEEPLADVRRSVFRSKHPNDAVYKELTKEIAPHDAPAEKLLKLLAGFRRIGFQYTMQKAGVVEVLKGNLRGDCSALATTFKEVASDYLGIDGLAIGKSIAFPHGFLAWGRTIDGRTGNVDSGKLWRFVNHFWIESPHGTYDVLFGVKGLDTSSWVPIDEKTLDEKPEVFRKGAEEISIWPTTSAEQANYYTTTPPKGPPSGV